MDRALHILVAEDDARSAKLLVHLLERVGHAVTVAVSGAEALAALAEHDFDLILMDVCMPGLSGPEATFQIRESERCAGGHLPIIGVSADAMPGRREEYLEAGMDDFIAKPLQQEELHATIRRVMESRA